MPMDPTSNIQFFCIRSPSRKREIKTQSVQFFTRVSSGCQSFVACSNRSMRARETPTFLIWSLVYGFISRRCSSSSSLSSLQSNVDAWSICAKIRHTTRHTHHHKRLRDRPGHGEYNNFVEIVRNVRVRFPRDERWAHWNDDDERAAETCQCTYIATRVCSHRCAAWIAKICPQPNSCVTSAIVFFLSSSRLCAARFVLHKCIYRIECILLSSVARTRPMPKTWRASVARWRLRFWAMPLGRQHPLLCARGQNKCTSDRRSSIQSATSSYVSPDCTTTAITYLFWPCQCACDVQRIDSDSIYIFGTIARARGQFNCVPSTGERRIGRMRECENSNAWWMEYSSSSNVIGRSQFVRLCLCVCVFVFGCWKNMDIIIQE